MGVWKYGIYLTKSAPIVYACPQAPKSELTVRNSMRARVGTIAHLK